MYIYSTNKNDKEKKNKLVDVALAVDCQGNLSGISTLTPVSWKREMLPGVSPERSTVFSFHTLKPQGRVDKQAGLYRSTHGDQQVTKGKDLLFQLFLQVILFQVTNEVMLGKQAVQAVLQVNH